MRNGIPQHAEAEQCHTSQRTDAADRERRTMQHLKRLGICAKTGIIQNPAAERTCQEYQQTRDKPGNRKCLERRADMTLAADMDHDQPDHHQQQKERQHAPHPVGNDQADQRCGAADTDGVFHRVVEAVEIRCRCFRHLRIGRTKVVDARVQLDGLVILRDHAAELRCRDHRKIVRTAVLVILNEIRVTVGFFAHPLIEFAVTQDLFHFHIRDFRDADVILIDRRRKALSACQLHLLERNALSCTCNVLIPKESASCQAAQQRRAEDKRQQYA